MNRTIATLSSNFKPPRGTKDLFSTALFKKRAIESTTKSIIESYGITEIITPTFDKKSLFHRALGTTTDVVSKEMYVLHNTDPELVLKPEGTAAVGRAILNNINEQLTSCHKKYGTMPLFIVEKGHKKEGTVNSISLALNWWVATIGWTTSKLL